MRRLVILAATTGLLVLSGCANSEPEAAPTAVTNVFPSSAATSPGAEPQPTKQPSTQASPKSDPTGAPTGPSIEFFTIKQKPSCPSSGPETSFPGSPIVLEWKAVNVDEVTISIDGPGVYDTYPAVHTQEFSFPCSGDAGTTQKHEYLLRTAGGGTVREMTVVGEARVN